jgi:hypothetical protein
MADEIFDQAENDEERQAIQDARARVINLYRHKSD